ncbi:N-acetylmuramoyl-L-alanine amidase [bacterium]|nr:N-acetylmuramoyl-L-alanine amidase [bacterium]
MNASRLLPGLVALTFSVSGCAATLARAAQEEAPAPLADRTYDALVDALPAPGQTPLKGRVIVVDPGHGGKEPGTVGPTGLTEKEVNLGVSKALANLLREAGAKVILTREGDTGVAPAGSSLADDLKARIAIANAAKADLFISVHHNATLDPKHERLMTETYYKMDDAGPSADAGSSIHRHLLRNLGLPQEKLVPGNYAVLRNAEVPAILGEASYLSHPSTEAKLRRPEKQLLEAQAYFAGILDYFAKGTPRVVSFNQQMSADAARTTLIARLDGGGGAIDPASVALRLDGTSVSAFYDAETRTVRHTPKDPLANGPHTATLAARNVGGNATPLSTLTFTVDRPAAEIRLQSPLAMLPTSGMLPLRARVFDALGLPVAEGTPVTWQLEGGGLTWQQTRTVRGEATNHVRAPKAKQTVTVKAGKATASYQLPTARAAVLMGRVLGPDSQPLARASVVAVGTSDRLVTESDESGYWHFETAPGGLKEVRVLLPGYRPQALALSAARELEVRLEASAPFALRDQLVVLNPEGGSEERDPFKRKLSGYNWLVAEHLRGYLEAAGARVRLTRGVDEGPSDIQRIREANAQNAALFVTIGHHASDSIRTSHYPTSAKGKQIAASVREALLAADGSLKDGGTLPDSTYVLIQTSCPSVTVTHGTKGLTTDDPAASARKEAYGILLGLLPKPDRAASLAVQVRGMDERAVGNALVTLDGVWHGQTDVEGRWRFANLAPGKHEVTLVLGSGAMVRQDVTLADNQAGALVLRFP